MSYRQKAGPRDIRGLHITPTLEKTGPVSPQPAAKGAEKMMVHHTGKEIRHIAIIVVPIFALLILSYYLDSTRHWVVPLGERLFNLGA